MSRHIVYLLGFICAVAVQTNGHSYGLGGCPVVEPQQDFEMNKMLGVWYVIQKTSTGSSCLTYNFTRAEEPDEYNVEQVSQHFALRLTPLKHEYRYTGRLKPTNSDGTTPARMTVNFPLSVAGTASYTVFMADYTTYAAIFTCQRLGFAHRQSATILSRTKTLDKIYVDKIRARLSQFNVDPFELSIISQKNCPSPHSNDTSAVIDIDGDTFSPTSIKKAVAKAGEVIGEGVGYVAEGAKTVYHKVAGSMGAADEDGTKEELRESFREEWQKMAGRKMDDDAEWLP